MHLWMPGPLVQAPPGGIAPRETISRKVIKGMLLNRKETVENQRPPEEPVGAKIQEEGGYNNNNLNLPEGLDLEPGQHHQQQEGGSYQDHHHTGHMKEGNTIGGEQISCTISMHDRMPGPKVQASPGGTTPIKESLRPETNPIIFKRMRQATLRWPVEEGAEMTREKEKEEEPKTRNEKWVGGGSETDNERYKHFLEYCEERRNNWARGEQEDAARMK